MNDYWDSFDCQLQVEDLPEFHLQEEMETVQEELYETQGA